METLLDTLLIYDTTGYIISQQQGSDLRIPVGVPYLIVKIPSGKYVKNIDVTVSPNVEVFEDLPPNEIDTIKDDLKDVAEALFLTLARVEELEGA